MRLFLFVFAFGFRLALFTLGLYFVFRFRFPFAFARIVFFRFFGGAAAVGCASLLFLIGHVESGTLENHSRGPIYLLQSVFVTFGAYLDRLITEALMFIKLMAAVFAMICVDRHIYSKGNKARL